MCLSDRSLVRPTNSTTSGCGSGGRAEVESDRLVDAHGTAVGVVPTTLGGLGGGWPRPSTRDAATGRRPRGCTSADLSSGGRLIRRDHGPPAVTSRHPARLALARPASRGQPRAGAADAPGAQLAGVRRRHGHRPDVGQHDHRPEHRPAAGGPRTRSRYDGAGERPRDDRPCEHLAGDERRVDHATKPSTRKTTSTTDHRAGRTEPRRLRRGRWAALEAAPYQPVDEQAAPTTRPARRT